MAIRSVSELRNEKIRIDLTGPQGNAFYLLGVAERLAKHLMNDWHEVRTRMESSDYENLVEVFESEFGEYVDLYR